MKPKMPKSVRFTLEQMAIDPPIQIHQRQANRDPKWFVLWLLLLSVVSFATGLSIGKLSPVTITKIVSVQDPLVTLEIKNLKLKNQAAWMALKDNRPHKAFSILDK